MAARMDRSPFTCSIRSSSALVNFFWMSSVEVITFVIGLDHLRQRLSGFRHAKSASAIFLASLFAFDSITYGNRSLRAKRGTSKLVAKGDSMKESIVQPIIDDLKKA